LVVAGGKDRTKSLISQASTVSKQSKALEKEVDNLRRKLEKREKQAFKLAKANKSLFLEPKSGLLRSDSLNVS
jgi:hypothetical protein